MMKLLKKAIPVFLVFAVVITVFPSLTFSASALVQTSKGNGGGYVNTYNLAMGSNVTAGSTLLACLTSGATDVVTITDNNSNTWAVVTTSTDDRKTELWKAYNTNAGATTITVTFQPARFADSNLIVREYSGLTTTDPLDQTAIGDDEGGFVQTHSTDADTATTAQADELLVACEGSSGASDPVFVAGTNYGNQTSQAGFDAFTYGGMEDRVVGSTGTYGASFTSTGFVTGQIVLGTFKIAGAGASNPSSPITSYINGIVNINGLVNIRN